jgi:hypothetical protein
MTTMNINESRITAPESLWLESDPGVYDQDSVDIDTSFIDGSLKIIARKAFDGVMYLVAFPDSIEVWWRRDLDFDPVKVYYFTLTGAVKSGDTWYQQPFDFDWVNNPDEVDATVVEPAKRFRIMWTKVAFGVTNYFGVDLTFTRRNADFMFFIFSPGKLVKLQADIYVRKSALLENRADNRGLVIPESIAGVEPTITDDTNWIQYSFLHERETVCEDADGRTPIELFQQEAGLTVR